MEKNCEKKRNVVSSSPTLSVKCQNVSSKMEDTCPTLELNKYSLFRAFIQDFSHKKGRYSSYRPFLCTAS